MSQYDDDIEFEFFEEEPPTEEASRTQRLPRIVRRPPGPPGPPRTPRTPSGVTPLVRLVGLIAFAILIIVLFVFWVKSCQGADKKASYEGYMTKVAQVGSASASIGTEMNKLLTGTGVKESEVESQLNGLAQRQQQVVATAQSIKPPGRLRTEQDAVVEALQFRASGLSGLENAFRKTADLTDADQAAKILSGQAQRFIASDVIWADEFKAPATAVLRDEGVSGVVVPGSVFMETPDLASSIAMKPIWQRIQGASSSGTPSGLHGSALGTVKVLPAGTELSQDTETTIKAVPNLSFQVSLTDSGDSQEVSIEVTLTIQKSPAPIIRKTTIPIIQPGETKTVEFKDLGQPPFGQRTSVKVDVSPVPGEKNLANNTAEYPVIFSLGS